MNKKSMRFIAVYIFLIVWNVPAHAYFDENFFDLCRHGTREQLVYAIRSKPELIKSKTPSGLTPLMVAAESNSNTEVINFLIDSGINVNEKMFSGMTALLWAAWKNSNPKVIEILIDLGADVFDEADNGKRAVDYAYMNENLVGTSVIKRLETGENPVSNQHEKQGVNTEIISQTDENVTSNIVGDKKSMEIDVFFDLCANGTPQEIWNAIKNENADPNSKNYYGTTPIMKAAEKNFNVNSVWWLYRAGADVNAKDDAGQTALMYAAVSSNNPDIINVLLKAGADINVKDSNERTALMLAARKNPNAKVVAALAQADGSKINEQGIRGWTALFWAAYSSENPEVIMTLINAGADPKINGNANELAVDYARRNKSLAGSEALKRLEELSK